MACAICQTRRPRRFCPGVRGDICSICCGTEREVTVDCPFDCEFLREARRHDKPVPLDPSQLPNQDIRVSEKFVEEHQPLLAFIGSTLTSAAMDVQAIDFDVREALDSLIRTYRTLQSGVYYETLPSNPLAAAVHQRVQAALADYRREETRQLGVTRTRDADILGLLVFLQTIEFEYNNGRRRGRAFLDALVTFYSAEAASAEPSASPIIRP